MVTYGSLSIFFNHVLTIAEWEQDINVTTVAAAAAEGINETVIK